MFRSLPTVSALLFSLYTAAYSAKFPENWLRCPKGGDNEECLKASIEGAVKDLKDGSKQLSIIPVDPLHFERLSIEQQAGSSSVNINVTVFDVDLIGASRLVVTAVKADWDAYKLDIEFKVNGPVSAVGDYVINGKMLILPIQGEGPTNITFDGFSGKLTLEGEGITKGSKRYFDVKKGQFWVDATKCYIWMGNLFNGIPNLGENMNRFMNENWKEILEELKQPISEVLGQAIQQIANVFFHKVPIDQVYTQQ